MAFSGSGSDECEYRQVVGESMGPGMYSLGTPLARPDGCDRAVWADAESELFGLPRPLVRCSTGKFKPGDGAGVGRGCGVPAFLQTRSPTVTGEDVRISNPPSTLRGTGINRWQPLLEDPQCHALPPWGQAWPSDDRQIAKDSHVRCKPAPLDPGSSLPPPNEDQADTDTAYDFQPVVLLPETYALEAP